MKMRIDRREDNPLTGEPHKEIFVSEKVSCKSCGKEVDDGDAVNFCLKNRLFYCDRIGCKDRMPSFSDKGNVVKGVKKLSVRGVLRYKIDDGRSLEDVKSEIREEYKSNELEVPDEEKLNALAEKRAAQESEVEEFMKSAVPKSEITV